MNEGKYERGVRVTGSEDEGRGIKSNCMIISSHTQKKKLLELQLETQYDCDGISHVPHKPQPSLDGKRAFNSFGTADGLRDVVKDWARARR